MRKPHWRRFEWAPTLIIGILIFCAFVIFGMMPGLACANGFKKPGDPALSVPEIIWLSLFAFMGVGVFITSKLLKWIEKRRRGREWRHSTAQKRSGIRQ